MKKKIIPGLVLAITLLALLVTTACDPFGGGSGGVSQQKVEVTRGDLSVVAAAMLHLPLVRMAVRAEVEDGAIDRRPPFCSQACAMVDRVGGGVDPVRHLADRLTEPADLARSPFYQYLFTLIP